MYNPSEVIKQLHRKVFGSGVADTSIKSYHELRKEGKINQQQEHILNAMKRNKDYSLQELCKLTGLVINSVSARVNELKEKSIIISLYKRKCSVTNRTIQALEINPLYLGNYE